MIPSILITYATDTTTSLLAGAPPASGLGGNLITVVLIFAVVYFVLLRPIRKDEKSRRQRLESLERGSQVVLTGGILGRVSSVDDKIAVVEIADKVKVRVLKKDISDFQENALKDKDGDDKKDDKKEEGKS